MAIKMCTIQQDRVRHAKTEEIRGKQATQRNKRKRGESFQDVRERFASMVKASRLQSTEDPSFLIWLVILPPYSSFHCHTRCWVL